MIHFISQINYLNTHKIPLTNPNNSHCMGGSYKNNKRIHINNQNTNNNVVLKISNFFFLKSKPIKMLTDLKAIRIINNHNNNNMAYNNINSNKGSNQININSKSYFENNIYFNKQKEEIIISAQTSLDIQKTTHPPMSRWCKTTWKSCATSYSKNQLINIKKIEEYY